MDMLKYSVHPWDILPVSVQTDWLSDSSLFAQEPVFIPRGAARQKEPGFCSPRTLILGRLLSNLTYVLTPVCAASLNSGEGRLASCFHCSAGCVSSHLGSGCYACLVREPQRTSDSWEAARVSSQTPRQVGAFLHNFFFFLFKNSF